tara:strand:+ start:340 stop:858 length:519 start_codon:yes stop_codon:yes gene_type:complete
MYNLIYNPIQNTYFKISSRNGIKTLKNFLNFYFGSGNQHKVYINPLKNQKVRLIYDGEPHKNLKTNKMIEDIMNSQWKMYKVDDKKEANKVRFCTYGIHAPFCPHYGIDGILESYDKVKLSVPDSLNSFFQRMKKQPIDFRIYKKNLPDTRKIDTPKYYWDYTWEPKCYNSK